MDDSTFKALIAAATSAATIGGLGAGFWFKKWITRVDTNLITLTDKVNTLVVADAVSKEQKSNFDGSLSQLQTCINSTTKDVGVLSASIQKLWGVIERIPGVGNTSRTSDKGIHGD